MVNFTIRLDTEDLVKMSEADVRKHAEDTAREYGDDEGKKLGDFGYKAIAVDSRGTITLRVTAEIVGS